MLTRHQFELTLMLLAAILVYLTYSPADKTYFWMYWMTAFIFLFFGYLMDVLFYNELDFTFDPNTDNWRRKTDPQR